MMPEYQVEISSLDMGVTVEAETKEEALEKAKQGHCVSARELNFDNAEYAICVTHEERLERRIMELEMENIVLLIKLDQKPVVVTFREESVKPAIWWTYKDPCASVSNITT